MEKTEERRQKTRLGEEEEGSAKRKRTNSGGDVQSRRSAASVERLSISTDEDVKPCSRKSTGSNSIMRICSTQEERSAACRVQQQTGNTSPLSICSAAGNLRQVVHLPQGWDATC